MNDKNTENSKIISNNIISNSALLQNDISNILSNINVLNSDLIQNAKNNKAQIVSEIVNSSETIKQQILDATLDSKSCVKNSLNSLQSEFKQTAESNKSQIVAKIDEVGNEVKLLNNMDLEKLIQKLNKKESSYARIALMPLPNKGFGYRKEWYLESADYVFEGHTLKGIKN